MAEIHHTFCRICEALCGLEVEVDDGRVTAIRPDDAHVSTRGFACVKGLKQHKMYDSPDRLKFPLKRVGDRHERISWEQALSEIGAKVARLRGDHSPNSIAMYVGTAAGFGVLHPVFAQGFMKGIGSASMFSSATQDCSNKFAVSREVYGFPFTLTFPDIERTQCLIIVGANPVVSKWSFLQVSNPSSRIKEISRRGGKTWVVDPRRTETAKVADHHAFIRPASDVFFYLAFLNEVIARGAVDQARVDQFMTGFETVAALAEQWTPERAEVATDIPAATLRAMVNDYLAADGAALYSSTGVNMGSRGALAFWLQEVINAVTGNLDRHGGTLVGQGVIDFPKFGVKSGTLMSSERSRIGDFAAVNDCFPGGILADEILTPGDRQIRAMFVTGGNPLITMANAGRLREAFKRLELLVCLDIQMSETASLADYVLPCTSPLQRPDLPFIFPLMLGLQTKPYLQATERVVAPEGEQRDEASIYLDLCRRSGVNLFGSAIAQRSLEAASRWNSRRYWKRHSRRGNDEQPGLPQEALLSGLLRLTRQDSFSSLLKAPHGRLRDDHVSADFLGQRVLTDDGKVHLAPSSFIERSAQLHEFYQELLADRSRLRLITKRAVQTHNSWTHNIEEFVEHERKSNYLYMNPEDATRLGLADADVVDVRSDTATVRIPMRVLADLMPGTVAMPHGWGHQAAKGMTVASRTEGVNVNILAADGARALERLSGMAHLTGIAVDVLPAAGPRDTGTWSGLPSAEEDQQVRLETR
ncbi:MAG: anaerobic selenocysteine-containing dehydrogenase [Hyphomicrobiaceae bacterium]|jgi:anaerobic selenocysteine-containing dehydrogenase